jgi:hypothetical protein
MFTAVVYYPVAFAEEQQRHRAAGRHNEQLLFDKARNVLTSPAKTSHLMNAYVIHLGESTGAACLNHLFRITVRWGAHNEEQGSKATGPINRSITQSGRTMHENEYE